MPAVLPEVSAHVQIAADGVTAALVSRPLVRTRLLKIPDARPLLLIMEPRNYALAPYQELGLGGKAGPVLLIQLAQERATHLLCVQRLQHAIHSRAELNSLPAQGIRQGCIAEAVGGLPCVPRGVDVVRGCGHAAIEAPNHGAFASGQPDPKGAIRLAAGWSRCRAGPDRRPHRPGAGAEFRRSPRS